MITFTDPYGTTWNLGVVLSNYRNNDNLYVGLVVMEDVLDEDDDIVAYAGEPYVDLSVNVIPLPENYIAVDCSYGPYDELLEENNLGTFTGERVQSGYSNFPIYKVDINELKKHVV